jgi:hypothetical protein
MSIRRDEEGKLYFEVDYVENESGEKPSMEYILVEEVRKNHPQIMIDFFIDRLEFGH